MSKVTHPCRYLSLTSRRLIGYAIFVAIFLPEIRAGEFCAVTLFVSSPDGKPAVVRVHMLDRSGNVELNTFSEIQGLKICDFGFGPHRIVISPDSCFPTTVSNLRVLDGRPITLHVIDNPCTKYPTESNGCKVYFRVRSGAGEKIAGATIRPSMTRDDHLETDSFGRAWTVMLPSMSFRFTASHEGYSPESLDVTCPDSNKLIEREFMLSPLSGTPH